MRARPRILISQWRALAAGIAALLLVVPRVPSWADASPARTPESAMDTRADQLLSQLTLDEKIQLVHGAGICGLFFRGPTAGGAGFIPGIDRLGIPDLNSNDGPVGVANCAGRPDAQATALPAGIAQAATWNQESAFTVGALIGREEWQQGMNVAYAGGLNLAREPRCGRTFEYLGEDPFLAGKIVAAKLHGVQSEHVVGTIKHYAGNQIETHRMTSSSNIDERTLRELYLRGFEIGVKESGVRSVMCSYNKVNEVYACEDAHLLNDILKGDWAFKGWVLSDFGATHSTVLAANSGLDEEQFFGVFFGPALEAAVQSGAVPASRLDDMVRRKLRSMIEVGLLDHPPVIQPVDLDAGEEVAQRVEEEAAVLLKNERHTLPLDAGKLRSIALIGSHADVAVLSGGGSSQVIPPGGPAVPPTCILVGPFNAVCQLWMSSSPLQSLQARAPRAQIAFDDGTNPTSAAALAASSDVAIVFANQWELEGADLDTLSLPDGQDDLIARVAAANPRTVVVLENGSPVLMPWIDEVPAVLESWYPGIRGAQAIAALLFGDVNPSGKLPITFPKSEADLPTGATPPTVYGLTNEVDYAEGLFMGYRWYDAKGIEPLFPFGHGLSYTDFRYRNLRVSSDGDEERDERKGTSRRLRVTFELANVGYQDGAEVAQIYLRLPAATGEPPRRLVGFRKVALRAGEREHLTVDLDSASLAIWDTATAGWRIVPGKYQISVGASSRDLRLSRALFVR
ncbi:MAG TPA: glycoside hydrolase family 3 C-terminal domain-containing protein [Myxococcota bacterium]|nr:glycoside hydrolase family 3 C-terminal domain-containing protein [Myxococcota bacterium]